MFDVLQLYAKKEATPDQVMRELCAHDEWLVPAAFAWKAFNKSKFDKTHAWGAECKVPANELWVFSGAEAGELAQKAGHSLGVYVGPFLGSTIFAALPTDISVLNINPGSPEGQGWLLKDSQIVGARAWGASVVVEDAMEGEHADLDQRLADFEVFRVLLTEDGTIAIAEDAGGMKSPGMVFTTVDSFEAARDAIGADGVKLKQGIMKGSALFRQVAGLGVDGLVFNVAGPGPTVGFSLERCKKIAALAKG